VTYSPPHSGPDNAGHKKKSTKKKWAAALSVAASVATILTLFITLGQQPQQNSTPSTGGGTTTTSSGAYPVNVESNFLNSCEANAPVQACQCTLSWFETHVSLSQFQQDEVALGQGSEPPDIVDATQACGG
jgi:hypothetical protein